MIFALLVSTRQLSGEQGKMQSTRENQEFETDGPSTHCSIAALEVNIGIFERFNERVDRLADSKFVEWTFVPPQQPQDTDVLAKDWLALRGLHNDEFDGFILNFRFLIQDRDGFSMGRVKEFYEKPLSSFGIEKSQFARF